MIKNIFINRLFFSSSSLASLAPKTNLQGLDKYLSSGYAYKNLSEQLYQQSLGKYQEYFHSSRELSQLEEQQIRVMFENLVEMLSLSQKVNSSRVKQILNEITIDKDLLQKLQQQGKHLQEEGYKIQKIETLNPVFEIKHLGHLHIKGLDFNKDNNKFIHEYKFSRFENELIFEERKEKMLEELQDEEDIEDIEKLNKKKKKIDDFQLSKKEKSEQMRKEMMEQFQQHQDSAVRKQLKSIFGKFGMKYGENDKELFELPDIQGKLQNIQKSALKSVNSNAGYILIEDFQIICNFGLQLNKIDQKSNENIIKEHNMYDQQLNGNLYHHYLRTATWIGKEAPSVKVLKERKILDIDGVMNGNPVCNVKRFDV